LDSDPLVGVGVAPGMAHASTSHAIRASTGTTIVVVAVAKESDESEDFKPDDDLVAHVEDPISSSGDEFDDWSY
jgi:hypothetical protein